MNKEIDQQKPIEKFHDSKIRDPKQIITPYAFKVSKNLLGVPLASPSRRLIALLIDLLLASILTSLSLLPLIIVVVLLVSYILIRKKIKPKLSRQIKFALGILIIIVIVITELNVNTSEITISNTSDDKISTKEKLLIQKLNHELKNEGVTNKEIQEIDKAEFLPNWSKDLIKQYVKLSPEPKDSITENNIEQINLFAQYYQSKDKIMVDSLKPIVTQIIAGERIHELNEIISANQEILEEQEKKIESLNEQIDNPSFLTSIKAFSNDLGIAAGWIGLYFILTMTIFNGSTIGKKLLKIKVVRLNGNHISIWNSFERFGGYAAGIATGLLGFLQIFWDPNRQGIHDKIAGTVVIDTRINQIRKYSELAETIRNSPKDFQLKIE